MKVIPYGCIQDLQPDGYEPESEPVVCRCGHDQDWHEQVGPCWECVGTCEVEGCLCSGFYAKGEDDEL